MKVSLLGTGDAVGTPKVGCSCPQCTRAHAEGLSRLRTSILVEAGGHHLLIDTCPDLRLQLLRADSPHIDGVVWTHGHYDHYSGFGDFYRVQKPPPVYAVPEVLSYCARFFTFLPFEKHPVEPFRTWFFHGLAITLFPVHHPPAPTYGLRIEGEGARIGYTSDTRADLPPESRDCLRDLDLLITDAMVPSPIQISKHMNYEQARHLAEDLRPGMVRFVHQSHLMPWDLPYLGRDMEIFRF